MKLIVSHLQFFVIPVKRTAKSNRDIDYHHIRNMIVLVVFRALESMVYLLSGKGDYIAKVNLALVLSLS